jgi:ElaB/YqjD/DUF883 family membrane-anchored ribosome-binding protein
MTEPNSVNDKVEALSADLADTVQDLIREAKPLLHHATDRMTDRVSELAHQSMEAACQSKRDMANKGRDLMDHASHMVRQEPIKAMLIAAGVGAAAVAIISMLSRPHHHHQPH